MYFTYALAHIFSGFALSVIESVWGATEKRLKDLRSVLDRMADDTRLCFVGAGPQEEELRAVFPDAVFTGQLEGVVLSQAFASADVFCMPSDSETLGFVVLESMASGVPVVGVKAGGVQDLIQDGTNGYLVDPGDTDAFYDRLTKLKHNVTLKQRMAVVGREEMEQWSWKASMAKLRDEQYTLAREQFSVRLELRLW
jgi:sulfoquinovosyltransferase